MGNQTSRKTSNIDTNVTLESSKKFRIRKDNDPLLSVSMKKIKKDEEFSRLT